MGWGLGEQCGAGGAQVIALGLGVDRQRHRRIVAVPGRDDVHWHAAGQHKADAGITEALEVDAAQAGALTQALELVGVPLMADGGAVLAYRDQTVIGRNYVTADRANYRDCMFRGLLAGTARSTFGVHTKPLSDSITLRWFLNPISRRATSPERNRIIVGVD